MQHGRTALAGSLSGKSPNRTSTKIRPPSSSGGGACETREGQRSGHSGLWNVANSVGQQTCPVEGEGRRERVAPGCVSLATAAAMRPDNCWEIVLFCCCYVVFLVFSICLCLHRTK